jgi:hypothetical protein
MAAISRNRGLAIFPLSLSGNASKTSTERGTMYFGRCRRQTARISSGLTCAPGRAVTKSVTASPAC